MIERFKRYLENVTLALVSSYLYTLITGGALAVSWLSGLYFDELHYVLIALLLVSIIKEVFFSHYYSRAYFGVYLKRDSLLEFSFDGSNLQDERLRNIYRYNFFMHNRHGQHDVQFFIVYDKPIHNTTIRISKVGGGITPPLSVIEFNGRYTIFTLLNVQAGRYILEFDRSTLIP